MDAKFLDVMAHEGATTIITINAHPASVVNTWNSYITIKPDNNYLLIPAAGMRSIEHDFETDTIVTLTMGSKAVEGTVGPGAGFHVHGHGEFLAAGPEFEAMHDQFPWLREVLKVNIDDIQQKI